MSEYPQVDNPGSYDAPLAFVPTDRTERTVRYDLMGWNSFHGVWQSLKQVAADYDVREAERFEDWQKVFTAFVVVQSTQETTHRRRSMSLVSQRKSS